MRAQYLILLAALAGCRGSGPEAARVTLGAEGARASGLASAVQVPIDSGNAAYRARDYAAALTHYRTAAERAPDDVTPWIGVSMAAGALRNQPLQDSANARIAALAPDLAPGAHPGAGEPPAGHP